MLSDEDKARIDEEEAYRLEARRRHARGGGSWLRWVLWFGGLVGLFVVEQVGVATYDEIQRIKRRENNASIDAKSPDRLVKFRGIAVVYPHKSGVYQGEGPYFEVNAGGSFLKCYTAERPMDGEMVLVAGQMKETWPAGHEMKPCVILKE